MNTKRSQLVTKGYLPSRIMQMHRAILELEMQGFWGLALDLRSILHSQLKGYFTPK